MMEPAVTLTDYLLAIECGAFALLVARAGDTRALRHAFVALFAALAIASVAGGTAHGFIADKTSLAHAIVWSLTLLAIGTAALAGWHIGACLVLSPVNATRLRRAAVFVFVLYVLVILFVSRSFAVAVIHYLPAALFLLAAFVIVHRRNASRAARFGAIGMGLSFVAAAVQASGVALHPAHLNHNVLYHLTQALAFVFLFRAARGLVASNQ
jgi:hypothetical protein